MENEQEKPKRKRNRDRDGSYRIISGILYARIQYQDESGKQKEKVRRADSKTDAWKKVREMRDELKDHGEEVLLSDNMTFKYLAEKYRAAKVFPAEIKDGKKIGGLKSYKSEEGNLKTLVSYFGTKAIRTIRPFNVEKFRKDRLEAATRHGRPRKIASVNRELSTLRAMLNFAVRNSWIIQNPCMKVANLVSASHEVERDRILSFEEEARLFSVLTKDQEHLRPILICALDTAMRPEEIFKLSWSAVDFLAATITVIAQNTKTEKERVIGMTERLLNELLKMWDVSGKKRRMSVFGTKSIKTAYKTTCRLAGLKDLRFRDFRHTATTRMVLAGIPHPEIMKVTGHTQMTTFLRYINPTKQSARDNAKAFGVYLNHKQHEAKIRIETANSDLPIETGETIN